MGEVRMMTETPSGHTEFDDLILLAERCIDDVVVKRTFERVQDRLRQVEHENKRRHDLLWSIRLLAEDIIAGRVDDEGVESFPYRVYDILNSHFNIPVPDLDELKKS
jgi:hypothetical protein